MISVVIPVYNEAGNVAILQREIAQALAGCDYEIVFVDDGSTDGTAGEIVRDASTRVIEFERHAGQSAAIHAGVHAASGVRIVLLDGDLQNDPADIPRLLEEIEHGADLVCGWRVKRQDKLAKRISSHIANIVRSRFTGDGIRDTGCTLKAMRVECREALPALRGMHRFIPALIKGAGYRLMEVPVNHRPRIHGESKYKFGSRVFQATFDMLGVRWLLSRRLHYRVKKM